MPTLHDVARAAGVSHMTVSRVVRGLATVTPATAERVRREASRLGYVPDPALSALASYRRNLGRSAAPPFGLAFLDCDGSEYSRTVFAGALQEAKLLGYAVERLALDAAPASRLSRILFHRGIRGLLFGPSERPRRLGGWDWDRFTAVSLGALSHSPSLHAVALDYFDGATRICQWLAEQGCHRIGLAVDGALEARTGHRWRGGIDAWSRGRSQPRPYDGPVRDVRRLLAWARREKADAVLTIHCCVNDALRPQGLRVAFLNDLDCPPGTPCLSLPPTEIGTEGVRLLHHLLLRYEFGLPIRPKTMLLQGTWRPGSLRESVP